MALQRDYKAPQLNVQDTRTAPGGQVAQADTRVAPPITFGDASWRDRLFEQLGHTAASTLDKMADVAYSNLYLEGQAKAGMIESEAEIQGNPLTRDWQVAGYRDTMGKLALADHEAQFAVDIQKLREGGPEEFQSYLAKRREKMNPAIAGMSREARASAVGQMLLQDRAAMKAYTTEHTKFIIEQKSQAVYAQTSTALGTLGAAQARYHMGDMPKTDFEENLRNTAGTIVGSIWMDTSLPDDVKQQLTFEAIQNTLANDSVELYDFLAQNEVPDGSGGSSTLMSRLNGKQQQQLANGYREAMGRTNDSRNMYQAAQVANIEAQIDNDAYMGTYEDLNNVLEPLVVRKTISGSTRTGLLNKFLDKQYKSEEQGTLAGLYMEGRVNDILNTGHTEAEAAAAMDARMAKIKVSPEQRLQTYLHAGLSGMDSAFQKAGNILGVTLRQMRSPDGTVQPEHMQTFRTINDAVRKAEEKGNANARMQLLSGLSESDRLFTARIMAMTEHTGVAGTGKTLDEAIAIASDTEAKEAAMSPSMRAAGASTTTKAVSKVIDEIEPMNWLETSWTFLKSMVSAEAGADLQLRTQSQVGWRDGWFSDRPVARMYAEGTRTEVRDEASHILLSSPSANADDVILAAKANVAARTVQTRHGPVFLPRGANAAQIFGVQPGNLSKVGPAIDKILTETKADARWHVAFTHRGVFAQEYDRDGNPIGNGSYLDPKQIGSAVQGIVNARQEEATATYGHGRTVKSGGAKLNYNGVNTAGVNGSWMLGFRDNLVHNEGVKLTPYEDLSGKKDKSGKPIMTVGVGVSSHNPRYPKAEPDGTISPQAIQHSFIQASNDAAIAGRSVAMKMGIDNKAGFMLMSELAYQSGVGFMSQSGKTGDKYRMFAQAVQAKDAASALEMFKQTAAWYYSADPENRNKVSQRQQHYLRLIEQSIQGG
jgi:hypothetical protein